MRALALLLAAIATFQLAACDSSDPFGLYPEQSREVVAPLELTGRVVDAADLLSEAEEQAITAELAAIETETLAELVVVTTPDLGGASINDYSLALGRGWGIGDAKRNDGLLLVVAPNERQVRIEVGYGLETTIEDPEAAKIIRQMIPYFERSDTPGGIAVGIKLLQAELRQPPIKEAT